MSVRGAKWTLLENYKKVATRKKEQIFWKTVSVAASVTSNTIEITRIGSIYVNTWQQAILCCPFKCQKEYLMKFAFFLECIS